MLLTSSDTLQVNENPDEKNADPYRKKEHFLNSGCGEILLYNVNFFSPRSILRGIYCV